MATLPLPIPLPSGALPFLAISEVGRENFRGASLPAVPDYYVDYYAPGA